MTTSDIVRILGKRFRDYRLRIKMTRKEVAEAAGVGMTTLYRFETGNMTDISVSTLLRLTKIVGLGDSWEKLLPELPESPYLYKNSEKKIQRVKHPRR